MAYLLQSGWFVWHVSREVFIIDGARTELVADETLNRILAGTARDHRPVVVHETSPREDPTRRIVDQEGARIGGAIGECACDLTLRLRRRQSAPVNGRRIGQRTFVGVLASVWLARDRVA